VMADGKLASAGDWADLQRKIFTRWVNQKLAPLKIKIDSVVTGFQDGTALAALLETLSEKKIGGKAINASKMRVQQIDNCNRALEFAWSEKVKMELPASAENLVDCAEKPVLGLVWAIMTRYLKFTEDQEVQLSAEEALLMWVNNQISSYALKADNFTKSFHDGKIFAALIHKNRPRLINPDDLKGSNEENIAAVFDAAGKYFGLEKYIEPSDIAKLDNKSAFVFTSEFYYGIAAQRKKDLAARRISKLIDYTKVNDALRADYKDGANKLKAHLEKVNAVLQDRTVDNTMAGAKAKLAQYYAFKKDDKGVIVGTFLKLEALFVQLSLRLEDHKRPAFNPGEGLTVAEFRTALAALDTLETERGTELTAELARQQRLVQLNTQHEARHAKLKAWVEQKETYLQAKEVIESSGAAEYQLNRLASYEDEASAVQLSIVADMNQLGAELAKEKYENSAQVAARETEIKADMERLTGLATKKSEVLHDDLARMKFKEAIHLVALKHLAKYEQIAAWINEKKAYLTKKEDVNSVNDAQLALSALDSFEADKKDLESTPVPALKALGAEILEAAYTSPLSSWKFEKPDEVKSRESTVESTLSGELVNLTNAKRTVLEEDLKRELEKERLRLDFAQQAGALHRWTKSTAEDLQGETHFGNDLDEVEAAKAKIDSEDKKNGGNADERKTKTLETLDQATKLGVVENPYTDLTPAALEEAVAKLHEAMKGRQERYAAELARVKANDDLCRQFAELANPLVATMDKNKNAVNEQKGDDLEAAAKQVDEFLAANLGAEDIKKIEELQSQIDAANVSKNKHSPYTAQDVSVRYSQYNEYLKNKKSQLAEQIKMKALRGLTEEQLREIDQQFKQFDKNSNQKLDKTEFKACLYSLGEERPTAEVQALMTEYGDEKSIPYDGFKRFMMKLLGDSETQPEILSGFKLLADDNAAVSEKQLADVFMNLEDVSYLKEHVPKDGDNYNYGAGTEAVFSR